MNNATLDNLDALLNLSGRSEMDGAAFEQELLKHCGELLRLARVGLEQEEHAEWTVDPYASRAIQE